MEYGSVVSRSVAYIRDHLTEGVTVADAAAAAGYSAWHFTRIFRSVCGEPPGQFILRQRLNGARAALLDGGGVLDVGIAYGFETASGFSKAFLREFGYSPRVCQIRMNGWRSVSAEKREGDKRMQFRFVSRPAFHVAGFGIPTEKSTGTTQDIPAYWEHYSGENLESKMYQQLCPPRHGEVGLCLPNEEGGAEYLLGVIVNDFTRATPDMRTVLMPAAEYAVFTTAPIDGTVSSGDGDPFCIEIKRLWRSIFEDWFPTSGYTYDEKGMDFEFYDERCHDPKNMLMEIWVPVRKK